MRKMLSHLELKHLNESSELQWDVGGVGKDRLQICGSRRHTPGAMCRLEMLKGSPEMEGIKELSNLLSRDMPMECLANHSPGCVNTFIAALK